MAPGTANDRDPPRWRWWLVFAFGLLTVGCGAIGVWKYEEKFFPGIRHGLSPLYHAAQMLILHSAHFDRGVNGWIEAGRWFGAATLFSATAVLLGRRLRHEFGLLRLATWEDHYVVCGLGQKGFEVAMCYRKRDHNAKVAIVDLRPDERLLEKCEKAGISVLTGDATQSKILRQIRGAHAREVVVVTPADEINVRIATELRTQISQRNGKALPCYVHVSDIHLREALQQWVEGQKNGGCSLHFFDVFDNEARRVLLELPIDGAGIRHDEPTSVHVVVIGFGRMGRSIALRAAKIGQFANGKPLRISVIDRDARNQRQRFLFRHPILANNTICNLEFHRAEAESLSARNLIEQWSSEPDILLHVFLCLHDDARAVEVAFRSAAVLQSRPNRNLLVRIRSRESLGPILEAYASPQFRIKPFGMIEDACSEEAFRHEFNEGLARGIHEQFVLDVQSTSLRTRTNDPALREWEELREDFRESNRQQADHLEVKLRAIACRVVDVSAAGPGIETFHPQEVEMLAELEHRRWCAERLLAGWRYGTPSDKKQRVSENLGSWEELDVSIQKYDRNTVTQIPAFLSKIGKKVCRAEQKESLTIPKMPG